MSGLPQPATVSVDKSRGNGIVRGLRTRWTRFKQNRNTGSSPSMFDKDFPVGGGSTEASTSITGGPDEGQRRREVYYALPMNRSGHSRDGEEGTSRFRTRRRFIRDGGKSSEPVETDDEMGDVDEIVVDNSFEVGGHQESLTEPSAGPAVTEHQPNVQMQTGQGKAKGAAYGWDPKDRTNGLNLSSSQ
jgi:hypothetical protein